MAVLYGRECAVAGAPRSTCRISPSGLQPRAPDTCAHPRGLEARGGLLTPRLPICRVSSGRCRARRQAAHTCEGRPSRRAAVAAASPDQTCPARASPPSLASTAPP
eukprot:3544287-Prymnesium_polylepis.1